MEKTCRKCNQEKPLDQFYKNRCQTDGHTIYCKDCILNKYRTSREEHKARARQYYRNNRERIIAYTKQEQRTPKGVARILLRRAVRDKKIAKTPCEVCGDPRSHGHHEDYSRPLEVTWLCARHHGALHRYRQSEEYAAALLQIKQEWVSSEKEKLTGSP